MRKRMKYDVLIVTAAGLFSTLIAKERSVEVLFVDRAAGSDSTTAARALLAALRGGAGAFRRQAEPSPPRSEGTLCERAQKYEVKKLSDRRGGPDVARIRQVPASFLQHGPDSQPSNTRLTRGAEAGAFGGRRLGTEMCSRRSPGCTTLCAESARFASRPRWTAAGAAVAGASRERECIETVCDCRARRLDSLAEEDSRSA